MISWARIYKVITSLWRHRIYSCLLHETYNIYKQTCFCDFSVLYTVKFRISQTDHFSCMWDSKPVLIEQSHKMSHTHDPFAVIKLIKSADKNILASLHAGKSFFQRNKKYLCRILNSFLFTKWINTFKIILWCHIFFHYTFYVFIACIFHLIKILQYKLFFFLKIRHSYSLLNSYCEYVFFYGYINIEHLFCKLFFMFFNFVCL